ncbi:MAG: HEPN domain-containing protein [Armatimonadetes bacterium]|nr:HEPN domain-containing protein [Armatimonadota bacterium]
MRSSLGKRLALASQQRLIKPLPNGPQAAPARWARAQKNLHDAEASSQRGDEEWAIVQSYYAAFHAFTALLMLHGYDESGHRRLYRAVVECFVEEGVVARDLAEDFLALMRWREDAQYHGSFGPGRAEQALQMARRIVETLGELLD